MELIHCYNKGCGQKFDVAKNSPGSCQYHPGGPIFHDAMKGWSCCKKRSTDFTEFLNFPGCTTGSHSNEKPAEPEKQAKSDVPEDKEAETTKVEYQKERAPIAEKPRPPIDEPLQKLKTTITPSLQKALDKKMQELSLESKQSESTANGISVGTACKNGGCKAAYSGTEKDTGSCQFHPGVPVFHEGMKYWSCCCRKTSDFTNFLEQAGCQTGKHVWIKQEGDTKTSCRLDWFQTSPAVNISVFAKLAVPEQSYIEVNQVFCAIRIVYEGGKSIFEQSVVLRNPIIPEKSEVKMAGTKVEIILKKAEAFSWPSLELKEKTVEPSS